MTDENPYLPPGAEPLAPGDFGQPPTDSSGPTSGTAPVPAEASIPWVRRRWVQVTAAGIAGLALGSAGAGSGQEKPTERVSAEIREVPGPTVYVTVTASPSEAAPAPAPTSAAPRPTTKAPAPPPTERKPADKSFRVETLNVEDDGLGDFGGTARVTNTASDEKSAIMTFTLFMGGKQVAVLQGAVDEVSPGQTVTVQLISSDDYRGGPFRYEFQVDNEF